MLVFTTDASFYRSARNVFIALLVASVFLIAPAMDVAAMKQEIELRSPAYNM